MTPALAAAHSKSEATTLGDGANVSEGPELSMRFDDPTRIISVTLTSEGSDIAIERETGMKPAEELRAMPSEALAPGDYLFEWRGMA